MRLSSTVHTHPAHGHGLRREARGYKTCTHTHTPMQPFGSQQVHAAADDRFVKSLLQGSVTMSKLCGSSIAGLLAAAAAASTFIAVAPPGAARRSADSVALRGGAGAASAQAVQSCSGLAAALPLGLAGLGVAAIVGRKATRSSRAGAPTAVKAFEGELGVQAPYGFWDPLDLTADGNKENFLRRRAVEIKHGRVSMYACIGYIVPECIGKFPGDLSPSQGIKFSDVPNGLAALSKVPAAGWAQIVLFCGLIENTGFFQGRQNIGIMKDASMTNGLGPGNYGLGWLGAFNKLKPEPKLRTRKLNSEIANGRLAMFAIMGLLFQNGTFGTTGPEMWWVQFPEYGNTVGDFIPKNLA
mmetsp:Transcript_58987/g.192401  ORF Transcript_58987/g.192401 Transcript_58987/m.192401 type:complete len:355 (+) Transcript_58987:111-1175(+)